MTSATEVFWSDLARDLEDPEFLREYIVESIRIAAIDKVMNELESARAAVGISKADLARSINANPDSVRRLLSSNHVNPTVGTLAEVAAVLGFSITLTPLSDEELEQISIPLRAGYSPDTVLTAKRFTPAT